MEAAGSKKDGGEPASAGGRRTTREALKSALYEASFVVLGVVLAYSANEWHNARSRAQDAAYALSTIVDELETNRAALDEAYGYHASLLELLHGEHEEGWQPDVRQFSRGFVAPARLSHTAWQSASETGALTEMEFEQVVGLSGAYASLARYDAQALQVGELMYAELLRRGPHGLVANHQNLASVISTFVYRERQLLDELEATIAESRARSSE
ncbi:MAG: hypothetical protein AAGC60_17885 [Acidobacteriota bacterium]